jgi:hypothetical protein
MPIQIPTDLTIVTLKRNGSELPQRFTPENARTLLERASALLIARADIGFRLSSTDQVVEEMPGNSQSDSVDDAGYFFLAARYKANHGARVLLVDKVSRPELGGEAVAESGVCLVAYGSNIDERSRMLAHELGHLLDLPHVDDGSTSDPGQERKRAAFMINLMFSGSLTPDAVLTPDQVKRARSSPLAKRFGGK